MIGKGYHGKFNIPGVGCVVNYSDKILLVRRKNYPWEKDWWTGVIGLAEKGEVKIQTVTREVKEEVGLDIVDVRPLRKDPYKTFAQDFASSYSCEMFTADTIDDKIKLNERELYEARFFPPEKLKELNLAPITKAILQDIGIPNIVLTENNLRYLITK